MRAGIVAGVAALLVLGAAAPPAHWTISDPGQGPVSLAGGSTGARELSGLTWAEGERYFAVSDKLAKLFPLTIAIDPQRGTITRAAVGPGVALSGSTDLEGVAYDRAHETVLVSDEIGPAIREYRIADGSLLRTLPLPPVFRNARTNLSLESLSLESDGKVLWTANEETLANDGPPANAVAGAVVRLLRLTRAGPPTEQWAYVTDPTLGNAPDRVRQLEGSGVSDLIALPDGRLLVLERAYGMAGLRTRLYEVDLTAATDVSTLPSLARARYVPARKTLLWERSFADLNYEGAALGPARADGSRSVVLIADDGHHLRQALYALTIRRDS